MAGKYPASHPSHIRTGVQKVNAWLESAAGKNAPTEHTGLFEEAEVQATFDQPGVTAERLEALYRNVLDKLNECLRETDALSIHIGTAAELLEVVTYMEQDPIHGADPGLLKHLVRLASLVLSIGRVRRYACSLVTAFNDLESCKQPAAPTKDSPADTVTTE